MEALHREIPKKDLATGIATSVLVHVLIFGSAVFAALFVPHKPLQAPYCSVDLVSMKDIGAGSAEPKGELNGAEKAVETRAKGHSRARRRAGPVVPIRRLAVKEPAEKIETHIKQIEPKASPAAPERTQGVESIDRNLDNLVSRPKVIPHSRRQVAREEREASSSAERQSSSGARSSKEAANEDRGEEQAPRGTPTGRERGGRQGMGPGSAFGSPNGSAAAMQILGMYGQMVKEKIQREWSLANDQGVNGLEAVVAVQITLTGQIVRVVIMRRSGNELFDEAAVRAVNRAVPLPPVPEAARGSVTSPQFILTFKPGKVSSSG